jgi:hypothetical protein
MRVEMVHSYVRDLLEGLTGSRPEPDDDGDLVVSLGGARFYVRVVNPSNAVVQVFSVGIADLEPTPELMTALNDINSQISFARAFHVNGQILIESEIWGRDVNEGNFRHACRNIAGATDRFVPKLLEEFGGTARFEQAKDSDYSDPEEPDDGFGAYL